MNIVSLHSSKGGVGKTMIGYCLVQYLAKKTTGKVCFVDLDLLGSGLKLLQTPNKNKRYINEYFLDPAPSKLEEYINFFGEERDEYSALISDSSLSKEQFRIERLFSHNDTMKWINQCLVSILKELYEKEYEYVIVDCPGYFTEPSSSIYRMITKDINEILHVDEKPKINSKACMITSQNLNDYLQTLGFIANNNSPEDDSVYQKSIVVFNKFIHYDSENSIKDGACRKTKILNSNYSMYNKAIVEFSKAVKSYKFWETLVAHKENDYFKPYRKSIDELSHNKRIKDIKQTFFPSSQHLDLSELWGLISVKLKDIEVFSKEIEETGSPCSNLPESTVIEQTKNLCSMLFPQIVYSSLNA